MRLLIIFISFLSLLSCKAPPESVKTWQHASNGTTAAAISTKSTFSIVSAYNQPTGWWDLEKNARVFNWYQSQNSEQTTDNDPAHLVSISADGSRAVTASSTNFVIWDTETGASTGYYKAPSKIRDISISNKANHVLLGLSDGRSIFISMKTGRRLEFFGHQLHAQQLDPPVPGEWVGINSVAISPNGRFALSGGDDHFAILWDTKSGQALYEWPHNSRVHYVALTNDGKFAFTASSKAEAKIWDLTSGMEVSSLKLKPREWIITTARFSMDNKMVATGSPGRDLKLWKVSDGSLIKAWKVKRRFEKKASGAVVLDVAFSEDGKYIFSEASSGYAEKWLIPK